MPKEYARSERLASQIQRELAILIHGGIKDPRLTGASIIEVQVSRDLAYARVYFSVLDPAAAADCVDAAVDPQSDLHASAAYRRRVGKVLTERVTSEAARDATADRP